MHRGSARPRVGRGGPRDRPVSCPRLDGESRRAAGDGSRRRLPPRHPARPGAVAREARAQPHPLPPLPSRAWRTLAIIGYRQPVSRPEVDAVRGVNSEAVLDNLLERRMIPHRGPQGIAQLLSSPHLRPPGKSGSHCGLRDLGDLPQGRGRADRARARGGPAAAQLLDPGPDQEAEVLAAPILSEQDPGPRRGSRLAESSRVAARRGARHRQRAGPARTGPPGGSRDRSHHA